MPWGTPLVGMKITVLGAGVSGRSLASLAVRLGASVFVSEAGAIADSLCEAFHAEGIEFESQGHSDRVLASDCVLVGSGFPPAADFIGRLSERGVPITGELDFVGPYLQGRLIGITGSNGKTTTTALLGSLLAGAGFKTATVGNIGKPIADAVGEQYDWIVAELSSFQLHWSHNLKLSRAIVTNIAPDHIDWHGSFEKYVAAKAKLISFLADDGVAITREQDAECLNAGSENLYRLSWETSPHRKAIILSAEAAGARLRNGDAEETLFTFGDTALIGCHNMENAAMALAAARLSGVTHDENLSSLKDFKAPPHRSTPVANIGGVSFVDDSKGTNVAATVTAICSLPGRKVVILGGRGKGEDYAPLVPALKEHARFALLIGEAAGEIADSLQRGGFMDFAAVGGMEEAVTRAMEKAEAGDMVLLSPACTSWDSYNNYGERGDHFAALVLASAEKPPK